MSCPACGTTAETTPFYEQSDIPVNSCLLVDDEQTAVSFPRGDLALALCPACGFVFNSRFDPASTAYSPDYEETQGFSGVFRDFIGELAEHWVKTYDLVDKTVVELGCGKGEFLTEMIRAGVGRSVGVDPGIHPERIPSDVADRLDCVRGFFPEDFPVLDADAVVCRHTLEHIAPVGEWMRSIRAAIGDRTSTPVLFELPDTRRVLAEGAFWDVYYEHCSYFTTGSLARLFRATGFEVLDVWRAYDDQYVIIEARPTSAPAAGEPMAIETDLYELATMTTGFARAQAEVIDRWRSRLRDVTGQGDGTAVMWGSGSKGVAFLAALGADASLVQSAVDINPFKHGKYMAGTGHRILAPDELVNVRPDLVIVMNPAYRDEVQADLDRLGLDTTVETL